MIGISASSASSTNAVVMTKSNATIKAPAPKTTTLKKIKKKGKKKSSSLNIKIKPFQRPPTLPPNFYDTSTKILYSSLLDILHQRTNTYGTTTTTATATVISREELYHKVTDLCSHGFGPKLYHELVHVLNEAAATCVLRLVGDSSSSSLSVSNPTATNSSTLQYPIPHCTAKVDQNDNNKFTQVYFTSMKEINLEPESFHSNDMIVDSTSLPPPSSSSSSSATTANTNIINNNSNNRHLATIAIGSNVMSHEDFILLGNIWKMYSDYVQYLNCVRLIFQSLDRMYVYLPSTTTTTTTTKAVSSSSSSSLPSNNNEQSEITVEAQILPRNDTMVSSTTSNSVNGVVSGPWNMWDVGMNCIYNHMSLLLKDKKQTLSGGSVVAGGDGAGDDSIMDDFTSTAAVAGIENAMDAITTNTADQHNNQFSILKALKQRTIARLIEELRNTSPVRPPSFLSLTSSTTTAAKQGGNMHQLIVRQCISIFRSFSHVSIHQTNAVPTKASSIDTSKKGSASTQFDIMEDFLSDLISAMTTFFNKESQSYMALLNDPSSTLSTATTPNKAKYDARAIIHHVNSRLKQMKSMTSYYSLSTTNLTSSLLNDSKMNYQSSSPAGKKHYYKSNNSTTRSKHDNHILSQLVESEFLTPHFSTNRILHPTNLHPIFDDNFDGSVADVKLLFQLSKRVHSTHDDDDDDVLPGLLPQQKDFSSVPHSAGMELLRISFERYGIESGLSIMRPNMNPNTKTPITSGGAGSGAGAVKPPPPMTSRDIQNKIVSNLLKFKSHLEFLLKEAFSSDEYFGKTLKKILEEVLNQGGEVSYSHRNQSVLSTTDRRKKNSYRHLVDGCDGGKRIAELLAKFIDLRFRNAKVSLASSPMRGIRSESGLNGDNDMESFMNASLDLFRHIQSKDVFEAFYRRDLSRRLLTNKSASIDIERSFVSKLKAECGTGYTSKMEGMFKDMDLSRDVMSNYSAHVGSLADVSAGTFSGISKSEVDMDIQVLTTGYWPVQAKHASLNLPDSLLTRKQHFESYYLSKYQGRRIAWQNTLGNCIVKAQFPKMPGPRELNVSLCQALVLMCFNVGEDADADPKFTIKDIMEQTGIDDRGEAERTLQSLSMGRDGTQVLRRVEEKRMSRDADGNSTTPKKKHKVARRSITDTDMFMFNSNFISNQKRIRITNIQMKETSEERSKTQEAVTLDRLYLIDAAIVRIMKARKTLDHRTLVGEAMKQLKFPASNTDIKKRIETLIEREYLERVEGVNNRYNYLA